VRSFALFGFPSSVMERNAFACRKSAYPPQGGGRQVNEDAMSLAPAILGVAF
jgi:hypothetical protein